MKIKAFVLALISFLAMSCSEKNTRKSIDFSEFKKTVTLTKEQESKFDEIVTKYKKEQEQNYEAAKAQRGQMDRVALGIKNEQIREKQSEEMSTILNSDQMIKFNDFVDKNSRKRQRYTNEVLEKIKTDVALSDEQFAMLNAANDAFEKAFSDAHDIYHGNNDLAKEYWNKFDAQRKLAIKKILSEEQYLKFMETVKDQEYKGKK